MTPETVHSLLSFGAALSRGNSPADVVRTALAGDRPDFPKDSLAVMGFFEGLKALARRHEIFPDAAALDEAFNDLESEAFAALDAVCKGDPSAKSFSNDYLLGLWAALGNPKVLGELVRRAKHRDGSTDAVIHGGEALNILRDAYHNLPGFQSHLESLGFTPSKVRFGDYPYTGLIDQVMNGPDKTPAAPPPAPAALVENAVQEPAPPVDQVAAEAAPAPVPAAPAWNAPGTPAPPIVGVSARANLDNATIAAVIGGNMVGVLRVTDALALGMALGMAGRAILIPMEGYAWADIPDGTRSSSTLLLLDRYVAGELEKGGTKLPARGETALEPRSGDGCFLAAEVSQNPRNGVYAIKVWMSEVAFNDAGSSDDFNDAKAKAAAVIRALLLSRGILQAG